MRNWIKTLLFLTAFSPVLISLAAVKYWNDGFGSNVLYYSIAGVAGLLLNGLIIKFIKTNSETIAFMAKKIKSNDAMILGMVVTYFLPFITKASNITMGVTVGIAVAGAVVLWFVSSIPPHPVLRLLSFRFYEVESATGVVYTLISQRELLDPKDIRQVKRISSSMLVEVS